MKKDVVKSYANRFGDLAFERGDQLGFHRENGNLRVMTVNEEPTMAQQQFRDQQDINLIMKRYKAKPDPTIFQDRGGVYADLTGFDFESNMNKIADAQEAFMTLNSDIRLKFRNDPAELLAFIQDPKNKAECVKLGLFKHVDEPQPTVHDETLATLKEIRDQGKKSKKESQE